MVVAEMQTRHSGSADVAKAFAEDIAQLNRLDPHVERLSAAMKAHGGNPESSAIIQQMIEWTEKNHSSAWFRHLENLNPVGEENSARYAVNMLAWIQEMGLDPKTMTDKLVQFVSTGEAPNIEKFIADEYKQMMVAQALPHYASSAVSDIGHAARRAEGLRGSAGVVAAGIGIAVAAGAVLHSLLGGKKKAAAKVAFTPAAETSVGAVNGPAASQDKNWAAGVNTPAATGDGRNPT